MTQSKSGKGQVRSEIKNLADLVQKEIEDGATTVEEIHKAIASLPLDILERLDVFEETVKGVRKVQDTSIGAIYDVIRRVNHEVGNYAKELLEGRAAHKPAHKPVHQASHKKS
jgi:methyl-accepting chemotaxis protein